MKKPISFNVDVSPPGDDRLNWGVRIEMTDPMRSASGWAESDSVGDAFRDALLMAMAHEVEPEEHA